jgi:hypothetical protein
MMTQSYSARAVNAQIENNTQNRPAIDLDGLIRAENPLSAEAYRCSGTCLAQAIR